MADRLLLTLGGCAANTAVDLVKMGVNAAVVGRIGADLLGRVVADMLREFHVETGFLQADEGADTSQTLIINVLGQDRRFIHTFGANAGFSAADIPLDCLAGSKVLYVGGFFLMSALKGKELAKVFAQARQLGVKTFLDVVTPPGLDYLAELEPLLPHVDVFKPNADEARFILNTHDMLQQAQIFRKLGAKTAVISCGSEGSLLVNDDVRLRAGTYPVEYVDASGGGDAFDAGFIYGMLHGLSTEDCLRYASALGASCVRAIGTTPGVFTRRECEEFLRAHELTIERV
jgi:sugar/nucleoside kinase (ribokinase family)